MYSLKESHILTRNQMHKLLYLERCGGVEFHLGTLDEDRAVREREAHASDVGVTERLPAVSLVIVCLILVLSIDCLSTSCLSINCLSIR